MTDAEQRSTWAGAWQQPVASSSAGWIGKCTLVYCHGDYTAATIDETAAYGVTMQCRDREAICIVLLNAQ